MITTLTVALTPSISQAADLDTLIAQPAGSKRIIFSDTILAGGQDISYMNGVIGDHPNTQVVSCTGIRDGVCAKASSLMLNFIVPPCTDSSKETDMCIKDLSFVNSAGTLEKAKLLYEIDTPKFAADPIAKTPAGGAISVWQGNSDNNSGGANTYGVRIGIRYNVDYNPRTRDPGVAYVFGFDAEIIPVSFKSGTQYKSMDGMPRWGDVECAWTEVGKCAVRQEFGKASAMSITFQIDNRISGWLSGRMTDTSVNFKKLTASTNLLTVTGSPIDVPLGYADITAAELAQDPDANATFSLMGNRIARPQGDRLNWQWGPYFNERFKVQSTMTPADFKAFEKKYLNMGFAKIFQKYLKSYPLRNSQWRLLGLDRSGFREGNWPECITNTSSFNGIVTTNAMLNDVSPARFEDDSLIYDVAGAHEGYDGKVFKGSYDLVMSSEVARCLYNFSSAPIKATISVTSSTGEVQNIATELVNEKNGWLTLSAKNFTFSAPTIRIKLSQDAPISKVAPVAVAKEDKQPVPVAEVKEVKQPEAAKALNPVAKKTIICTKGKLIKKVSGTSAKCPAGYRVK
ncbi:MAG: hypothetical protein F2781_04330 [Actinobacteria bacterium]|nr:hypothetical protein [Actinomycetota bacterium]